MNTEGQLTARAAGPVGPCRRCGTWWPKPRTVPAQYSGRVALEYEVFALPDGLAIRSLAASAVFGRGAQHV